MPVMLLAFATLGGVLGLGQFLAARSIARNPLWIVASAVGLTLGWFIPSAAQTMQPFTVVASALVYGICTAAAMWWSARQ